MPINKRVSKEYFLKHFLAKNENEEEIVESIEIEDLVFESIENINHSKKIKQTKLTKQGSKFEQKLIKLYKKEGWKVTDGTGENFEEFDAEGIDIILEKDNKVILVQAKIGLKKSWKR